MPLQRYVGSHVSAHHQPLSPSFVRTATHAARPAFRTLKGAPLAGPAYPRELPLLAKQTTRPPPPCLSSPAMTPAVAWLAWATRETRYRPTAHEHKHQSLPDTPPRAPIVGLAPVKYSCPFQHFLRTRCCFCYVTSSLLASPTTSPTYIPSSVSASYGLPTERQNPQLPYTWLPPNYQPACFTNYSPSLEPQRPAFISPHSVVRLQSLGP